MGFRAGVKQPTPQAPQQLAVLERWERAQGTVSNKHSHLDIKNKLGVGAHRCWTAKIVRGAFGGGSPGTRLPRRGGVPHRMGGAPQEGAGEPAPRRLLPHPL